jgi:ribosomal protein S18 acetylase RimI-like enzyme
MQPNIISAQWAEFAVKPVGFFELTNNTFGRDYISTDELDREQYQIIYCYITDKLCGFVLFSILSIDDVARHVSSIKPFPEFDKNPFQKIGFIKSIAVDPNYRNQGIGKQLLKACLLEISAKSNAVFSVCWLDKNGNSIFGEMLRKQGFIKTETFSDYWYSDSLKKQYSCALCGPPPCRCAAEVWLKTIE